MVVMVVVMETTVMRCGGDCNKAGEGNDSDCDNMVIRVRMCFLKLKVKFNFLF